MYVGSFVHRRLSRILIDRPFLLFTGGFTNFDPFLSYFVGKRVESHNIFRAVGLDVHVMIQHFARHPVASFVFYKVHQRKAENGN